ncbi:MAG: glutaredoxin family protein [Spirochaetes bacterium]|nr:glutaredoxin family protein [Spirochaetota bacterium]
MKLNHVKGKKTRNIVLFALSTCIWCKKTRSLLEELGVEFDYIYVDLLPEDERDKIEKVVEKWNESVSFPTIVIDDKEAILGFDPDEIKEKVKP